LYQACKNFLLISIWFWYFFSKSTKRTAALDAQKKCRSSKSSDILYCIMKIEDFKSKLQETRNNFDFFWNELVRTAPRIYSVKRNRMEPIEDEDRKSTYKRLYLEIIDIF
ncbi:hypothetical protein L9F63_004929, partial [Diploptera punctata]